MGEALRIKFDILHRVDLDLRGDGNVNKPMGVGD